ncbi:ornithine decarboxylase [Raphidocelis subcapitata]|uniref:ornithine decarboxylase n=1 Tax=Raphidocelis subcapitata TaxID=307507 RepID=A0A2V0PLP8_9CHLO|nr:ornithine decarboxylase [Raphidocelis subcapitata]|eukprot:GBF98277.1 ornithine decarboxylase [Raphidocelis subcapitata]
MQMDLTAAAAAARRAADDDTPLSPAKRAAELKRRSTDRSESVVPPSSAPKLHCTFSAKLVDLMSNFSVVDAEAESEGAAAAEAGFYAASAGAPEAPAVAVAVAAASDDASSGVSESAALCPVPEGAAFAAEDEASGPAPPSAAPAPALPPLPAAAGLASVFESYGARSIASAAPADVAAAVRAHLKEHPAVCLDTLYAYDLAQVARMHAAWIAALPRVTPYYAVKCNPEPALLAVLEALGCGFDCASQVELSAVVARMGVAPGRVIFANPSKRPADIAFARKLGVERTTFDTECELLKIAAAYPSAGCVLRLRCDDAGAQVQLGLKYGAEPHEVPGLLAAAKRLGLRVVGVSFHVGSGVRNYGVYAEAVRRARAAFDAAAAMGFHEMALLDVGGGFVAPHAPGPAAAFVASAAAINSALEAHFPEAEWPHLQIISEPGRYFAESAATLVAPVYSIRHRTVEGAAAGEVARRDYWITDGLYGSFNCILYDDQHPTFRVMRSPCLPPVGRGADAQAHASAVWGPTCDSADCVYNDCALPELRVGDCLVFSNAGAYTVAGACDFNGLPFCNPRKLFVASRSPAPTA